MRHLVSVVCHGICCRHVLQVIPLSCLKYGANERWLKVQPELVMKKAADEMQEVCRRHRRHRRHVFLAFLLRPGVQTGR